jgi:hypothetical protein
MRIIERVSAAIVCIVGSLLLIGYLPPVLAQPTVSSGGDIPAYINIGVGPPRFELDIGVQSKPQSFRVVNFGEKPVTFRVTVHNWEFDEHNEIIIIPPTEQSLDQWITINPLQFTVQPEKTQVVRFSIRPRVKPTAGEHRAIIYVSEVPPSEKEEGRSSILGRFGVVVYGYVGTITRIGTLHDVKTIQSISPISVHFDISSEGTAHVRMKNGQYAIWSASAYPGAQETATIPEIDNPETKLPQGIVEVGFLPTSPVLPGTRRTILLHTTKRLPPGEYVLDIHADLSGIPIDLGQPFVIPAERSQ